MSKFYCNVCDEEVTLENGKCPKCNTDWEKIINENTSDNNADDSIKKKSTITDDSTNEDVTIEDGIYKTINFFLNWAGAAKIFYVILAIITAIISICGIAATDGFSLLLLVVSVILLFTGNIFENSLKWKAYMLYTNMNK